MKTYTSGWLYLVLAALLVFEPEAVRAQSVQTEISPIVAQPRIAPANPATLAHTSPVALVVGGVFVGVGALLGVVGWMLWGAGSEPGASLCVGIGCPGSRESHERALPVLVAAGLSAGVGIVTLLLGAILTRGGAESPSARSVSVLAEPYFFIGPELVAVGLVGQL